MPGTGDFDYAYFRELKQEASGTLSMKAFLATEQRIPGLGPSDSNCWSELTRNNILTRFLYIWLSEIKFLFPFMFHFPFSTISES